MRRAAAALHRVDLQRTARIVVAAAATAATDALGGAMAAPAGYLRVGPLAAVPEGLSELQLRPDSRLVLARRAGGGGIHALGGDCPHRQAQLAVGDIEDGGTGACCVICPRHRKRFEGGLRFDVETGRAFLRGGAAAACEEFDRTWRLPVHDVLVVGGELFVSLEPRRTTESASPPAFDPSAQALHILDAYALARAYDQTLP